MIGVLGATGKIGGEVAVALRDADAGFCCIVRDRDKAASKLGSSVSLRDGDLSDPATLERAFAGLERLFLVCGLDPELGRLETNAVEAAVAAGVRHVVKCSAAWPIIAPDSPTTVGRQHLGVEERLKSSGLAWTILRPCFLMQNSLSQAVRIATENRIALPVSAETVVAMIDTEDIGACAARALTEDAYAGRTFHLTGAPVTFGDIADTFSRVLGRAIRLDVVAEETARANMQEANLPEWMAIHFLGMGKLLRNGALAEATNEVEAILGLPPRDVAHYVEKNRGVFGG